MKFEKFCLWLMCVAVSLCVDAMGIARYGGEVNPREEWLIILSAGTILWVLVCCLARLARNRYLLRTRIERWWDRQLPFWFFI